jgi:hypothetical protein
LARLARWRSEDRRRVVSAADSAVGDVEDEPFGADRAGEGRKRLAVGGATVGEAVRSADGEAV